MKAIILPTSQRNTNISVMFHFPFAKGSAQMSFKPHFALLTTLQGSGRFKVSSLHVQRVPEAQNDMGCTAGSKRTDGDDTGPEELSVLDHEHSQRYKACWPFNPGIIAADICMQTDPCIQGHTSRTRN